VCISNVVDTVLKNEKNVINMSEVTKYFVFFVPVNCDYISENIADVSDSVASPFCL